MADANERLFLSSCRGRWGKMWGAGSRGRTRQCASCSLKSPGKFMDCLVKRIGVDHVGVGTDFNHGAGIVGFNDASEAPNVTRELVRPGVFGGVDPQDLWGGNFLRVFRQVETVAGRHWALSRGMTVPGL